MLIYTRERGQRGISNLEEVVISRIEYLPPFAFSRPLALVTAIGSTCHLPTATSRKTFASKTLLGGLSRRGR